MGCNIHMILEVKHGDNWIGLHDFHNLAFRCHTTHKLEYSLPAVRERNYKLFSALADVRSEHEGDGPEPKGMPADPSDLAQYIVGDNDNYHSHTWYLLNEALPIFIAHCAPTEMLSDYRSMLPFQLFGVDEGDEAPEDVYKRHRLIIFFDRD